MNLIQKLSGEQHLGPVLHFHHHTSVKKDGGGTTDNTFSSHPISCVLIVLVLGSASFNPRRPPPDCGQAEQQCNHPRCEAAAAIWNYWPPVCQCNCSRIGVFLSNVLSVAGYLNAETLEMQSASPEMTTCVYLLLTCYFLWIIYGYIEAQGFIKWHYQSVCAEASLHLRLLILLLQFLYGCPRGHNTLVWSWKKTAPRLLFLPHVASSKKRKEPTPVSRLLHLNPTHRHKVNPNPEQADLLYKRSTSGEYLEAPVQKLTGRQNNLPAIPEKRHGMIHFNFSSWWSSSKISLPRSVLPLSFQDFLRALGHVYPSSFFPLFQINTHLHISSLLNITLCRAGCMKIDAEKEIGD